MRTLLGSSAASAGGTATPEARPGFVLGAALAVLHRRQPRLTLGAYIALLGALVTLALMSLDPRTINDVNVWVKPTKFFVSLAVYYATLAWAFGYLPEDGQRTRAGRFVIAAPLAAGLYEMSWIVLAAAKAVPSHFNHDSLFWLVAFRLGGIGSVVLIAAILVQGVMIGRQRAVPIAPALRWGIVAGAIVAFGATLITAGYMAVSGGHAVGGVAGAAGAAGAESLPLVGWSRTGGDLRVAHFFALHAQQALPALGLLAVASGRRNARAALAAAAVVYVGLVAFTFAQALRGAPFIG